MRTLFGDGIRSCFMIIHRDGLIGDWVSVLSTSVLTYSLPSLLEDAADLYKEL